MQKIWNCLHDGQHVAVKINASEKYLHHENNRSVTILKGVNRVIHVMRSLTVLHVHVRNNRLKIVILAINM